MSLEWTERLSVGNELLDLGIKNLIDMVNDIEKALKLADKSSLSQTFKRMDNFACEHFECEKKIALAVSLPFDTHMRAHQHMQRELHHIRQQLVAMDGVWSEGAATHFATFMENWVVDHVTREDMLMKPVLQSYPYDFKPN